jgi:hypothetical protein
MLADMAVSIRNLQIPMEVSELQARRNLYDHCPSEDEAGTGRRFNSSHIQQLNIILKSSFKLSGTSSDAERNKNTRYWLLQTTAGHHFTIYKSPPRTQFKMTSNL